MAGYAARNSPANGKQDSLTVRAIVVEKTALVVADVIGIDSEMSAKVQFIFVTHNKISMEKSSHLLGVTMRDLGVSKVVSVDVEQAMELAQS